MTARGVTPSRVQSDARAKGPYLTYTQHGGADRDWQHLAVCRGADPEIFFPYRGSGRSSTREYRRAVLDIRTKFCDHCPVIQACLNYAITLDNRYGVWGGKGEHERPQGGVA